MDIDKINFIKKSFVVFEGKSEKLLIYRETGNKDFNFVFKCPRCGVDNDFKSELVTEKIRESGKTKEMYVFSCGGCGQRYAVQRLKPPRGNSK